jgi:hypothetical protein
MFMSREMIEYGAMTGTTKRDRGTGFQPVVVKFELLSKNQAVFFHVS